MVFALALGYPNSNFIAVFRSSWLYLRRRIFLFHLRHRWVNTTVLVEAVAPEAVRWVLKVVELPTRR